MKAIKTFRGVINRLNQISNINQGGCAVSALAMYRWLEQHNQLDAETCITYLHQFYDIKAYRNNLSVLRKGEGDPQACCHAVLWHKGKFYDSEGCFTEKLHRYSHIHKIKNLEFIIESINNSNQWNWCFNRREQLPVIEKLLGIELFDLAN